MSTQSNQTRWFLKKTARKAVATTTCNRFKRYSEPAIRVLTYHRFGESRRDPFCVSVQDFENQMSYLAEHNLAVSLEDVEGFVLGHNTINPGSILVTIDDGYHSVYSACLPILTRFAIPAVAFITPGLISHANPLSSKQGVCPEPYMNWEEIGLLHDSGVAIGSHSLTHRSLARIPNNQAYEEIFHSREIIQKELGDQITSFAYPFGTRADFNAETASLIKDAGYTCAFTSQHGRILENSDAYTLPRVKVEGGEPSWLFQCLVQGGLDAWRWVDKALWRIQASGNG